MRQEAVRATVAVVFVTGVLAILLAGGFFRTGTAVAAYALVVAAILLAALVRTTTAAMHVRPESPFEYALRRPEEVETRPAELVRVERDLALGVTSGAGADLRLLPMLQGAAAARLLARRGIELDRRPELARDVLGDRVWALVRPDRPPFRDRAGPGVRRDDVAAVVDALERI